MEAKILFEGNPNAEVSQEIKELGAIISVECDVKVAENTLPPTGREKGDGLLIGLSIASLAVSSISSFIAVLNYWRSSHPRYSITVSSGDVELSITNLKKERLLVIYDNLKKAGLRELAVKIRRR